jgi:biotin-(acetyl-CoA carboxylase) ligase
MVGAGSFVVLNCAVLRMNPTHPLETTLTSILDPGTLYLYDVKDGIHQFRFPRLESTHSLAQKWPWTSLQNGEWIMLLADEQTGGRGQRSNVWSSPVGNLYMTLIFRIHNPHIIARCLMTQATALTVAQALDEELKNVIGAETDSSSSSLTTLKWINDVFLHDKKVCGTLISADNVGMDYYYQVSMGVNVNVAPVQDLSISLHHVLSTPNPIPVEPFAVALARRFKQNMEVLFGASESGREQIRAAIDAKLQFKHQRVNIWDHQLEKIEHSGVFVGINAFGHARIQDDQSGTILEFYDGRMRPAT